VLTDSVAVIGLGAMGGRAAGKLASSGVAVRGFDPAPAYDSLPGSVTRCPAPGDAAQGAGLVLLSLPGPDEVLGIVRDLAGTARGSLIVDASTIDPGTARAAAAVAAESGAVYVDAPVLGRPQACGQWTLVAGGPEDAVRRAAGLLEGRIARQVVHVGETGTGSAVKIMNNLMFGAINAVTAEALAMCEAVGVDPGQFVSLIAGSGAATVSGLFREIGPKIAAADFSPRFSLALLDKDTRLAVKLAEAAGTPAFMARCVEQVNRLALDQGFGAEDSSAVWRVYRALARRNPAP
jgi:3-hydroxyisobutyrate dehydrogenase